MPAPTGITIGLDPIIKADRSITIQQLDFKNKLITLKLRANNFQYFDKLAQALRNQGLLIEQRDARREDKYVTTLFVIRKTP